MTDYKNELRSVLYDFLGDFKEKRYLSEGNTDEAIAKLEALLSQHSKKRDYYDNPTRVHDVPCGYCGSKEWVDWVLLPHELFNTAFTDPQASQYLCFDCFLKNHPLSKKRELEAETKLLEHLATSDPRYTHAAVIDELADHKDQLTNGEGKE